MYEIEKRVLLNKKQFAKLFRLFKQKGKFKGEFKRFSLIMVDRADFVANQKAMVDIRVRTTGESGKFTIKYGNWHLSSSRQEYEVSFKTEDTPNLVNMIRVLGYNYFISTYVHRSVFEYEGFTITLDDYYSSPNNLMEIEKVSGSKAGAKKAEIEIDEFLKEHKLHALSQKETIVYIQSINDVKKMRVDLTKTTVAKWFKKWKGYIYCLK